MLLVFAGQVHARRESTFRYPYSLVWTTVVRMVRIDFESPITEKDRDEGYLLFDFPQDGKQHSGSFEVIRQTDSNGVESVRVVAQIAALPSYIEQMLLDKLERKLSKEHGVPLERKSPSDKPKPDEPSAPNEDDKDKPAAPSDGDKSKSGEPR